MNILQLANNFDHGGVSIHITELSEELLNRGHNVIVASSYGSHVDDVKNRGIAYTEIEFSAKNPFKIIGNITTLIRLIKSEKIDIVHCQNRSCALYMKTISAMIGVTYIWSLQQNNIPSDFIHRMFTFYGKRAICPSTEVKEYLVNSLRIPEKDITLVYNGINIDKYQDISEESIQLLKSRFGIRNEKVITLLGRLTKSKGQICLLEAVGKLKNKEAIKVIFVGDEQTEYRHTLDEIIKSYGIEKQIIFLGFIPAQDVLSISDLMVLPSQTEGFSLAVLNAFAMNIPVVRTKTGGYIDTKDYCIGMEFDDSNFLAQEITSLINGKDYSKMVGKALVFVQQECSIEAMTSKILGVYGDVATVKEAKFNSKN